MADITQIEALAAAIRRDVLDMTFHSGVNGGHLGGALSSAEIFAVLYGEILNINPDFPLSRDRDRFILSKGHTALAHYAVLAEIGFMTKEDLLEFEVSGSNYPTHEIMNISKGIEFSSGSLGYGASLGVGSALMAKRRGEKYRVFVLLGDGECNEGSVWEALMSATRFRLDNLTFVIDVNKQQLDGYTDDVMPINDFKMTCMGLGLHVIELDGNDVRQLLDGFGKKISGRPTVIIANTVKGKGIASIEGRQGFHHVQLSEQQYEEYKKELRG